MNKNLESKPKGSLFAAPLTISTESVFDRYRPQAVAMLTKWRTFDQSLERERFQILLVNALPDFAGDTTDALAMLREEDLLRAVSAIVPVELPELYVEFPVLRGLADALQLSQAEQTVMAFLAVARDDWYWSLWDIGLHEGMSRRLAASKLAQLLQLEEGAVQEAFYSSSALMRSGLFELRFSARHARLLDHFPFHADVDASLFRTQEAWNRFYRQHFEVRSLADNDHHFHHLSGPLQTMMHMFGSALQTGRGGIHALLYGPPGTGKTTLAREVARRLDVDLVEVRKEFVTTGTTDGETRLASFNMGQMLGVMGEKHQLMLFDELEDLLPRQVMDHAPNRAHKGWICQSLEQARIPTLWTANSIRGIDPAILRRFSIVQEISVPPLSARRHLVESVLSDRGISPDWRDRVARLECLTPAMTRQLADLADMFSLDSDALETALDAWLDQQLKANDKFHFRGQLQVRHFHEKLWHIEPGPSQLIDGLRKAGEGRLCLHGPPGTGKTAFANYLADSLDRPAMVRRGSDIRSMYVGETERNIAEMFQRSRREEAVLILDEADSFLSARSGRNHRWEMNEVTEFLVQLESFDGIFCATTNRFEDLDPAFVRRFDMKLYFGYLDDSQRRLAMRETLRQLGCKSRVGRSSIDRLSALNELTPGDFATASRRLRFSCQPANQETLLSALVHEVECRNIGKARPIGFHW